MLMHKGLRQGKASPIQIRSLPAQADSAARFLFYMPSYISVPLSLPKTDAPSLYDREMAKVPSFQPAADTTA